LCGRQDL